MGLDENRQKNKVKKGTATGRDNDLLGTWRKGDMHGEMSSSMFALAGHSRPYTYSCGTLSQSRGLF